MNFIVGQVVVINNNIDKSYPSRENRLGQKGMIIQKYIDEDDGEMYVDVQFKYKLDDNMDRIINQGCFLFSEVTEI